MPALPDDGYLAALGRALYMYDGLEWLVIEVIRRLDPETGIARLAGKSGTPIAEQLLAKIKKASGLSIEHRVELQRLAKEYARLPEVRNHAGHARPATMPDGRQRLYRWAPTRTPFAGWIDETFLADLYERVVDLARRFDGARAWLPPLA